MFKYGVLAIGCAIVLLYSSGLASAAGWNHDYSDEWGEVLYPNVDITTVRSYESGQNIILEMSVLGAIENSSDITYWIWIGSEDSGAGVYFHHGDAYIYYVGGGSTSSGVEIVLARTLRGTIPKTQAGESSNFDVIGYAIHDETPFAQDFAGAAYQNGIDTPVDNILGFALWTLILIILIPIIIIIVIVVLVVVLASKKPAQPPMQPPMQGPPPQYPPQQSPQQPPQQYPPPFPPQGGPPRPPK